MEHLQQLIDRATQVRSTAFAYSRFEEAEKYGVAFNSWLLNRPSDGIGVIWYNAIFECSVLSESSLFLAVHGFYEEACALLRAVLDGFLARLYWDIRNNKGELNERIVEGRSTNDYCEWELGTADEFPRNIWRTLLNERQIAAYDSQYHIRAEVVSRLRILNRYVHGRPASRHYDGSFRSSTMNISFKSRHFDEWCENLHAVYQLVFTLSFLQYPSLSETENWNEFETLEPDHALRLMAFRGS